MAKLLNLGFCAHTGCVIANNVYLTKEDVLEIVQSVQTGVNTLNMPTPQFKVSTRFNLVAITDFSGGCTCGCVVFNNARANQLLNYYNGIGGYIAQRADYM